MFSEDLIDRLYEFYNFPVGIDADEVEDSWQPRFYLEQELVIADKTDRQRESATPNVTFDRVCIEVKKVANFTSEASFGQFVNEELRNVESSRLITCGSSIEIIVLEGDNGLRLHVGYSIVKSALWDVASP